MGDPNEAEKAPLALLDIKKKYESATCTILTQAIGVTGKRCQKLHKIKPENPSQK